MSHSIQVISVNQKTNQHDQMQRSVTRKQSVTFNDLLLLTQSQITANNHHIPHVVNDYLKNQQFMVEILHKPLLLGTSV